MNRLRVIMAGGGTGGHLYPGLAVAAALEKRVAAMGNQIELVWAATPRAVDQRLLSKFGERYVKQAVQPFPGVKAVGKWWGFWRAWRASCAEWARSFDKQAVDCVVALGGYAAGPAAYVAAKRRIPVVLLNPDALPGRANRFLFKWSDVIVTQWPLSAEVSRGLPGQVKALGCPIRSDLLGRTREDGARRLGVDGSLRTLIVTGASLGAKTINDAMVELLADAEVRAAFERGGGATAAGKWQIIHLAGMDQAAAVSQAYAAYAHPGASERGANQEICVPAGKSVRAKVIDYCDDMASIWAVADLAIARAGASTCAELTACGVPSILLPYPFHKDMHQRANAEELVKVGAAAIVDDKKDARLNAAAVKSVLQTLLYDEPKRQKMAAAARAAGKPEAADAIAAEILALIEESSR